MIDWNGNGKIDPTDIGISIAVDEQDQEPVKPVRKSGGCLTSLLLFFGITVVLPAAIIIL